jgi:hypothetical protein
MAGAARASILVGVVAALLVALALSASAADCGGATPCACGDHLIASRTLTAADSVTTTQCATPLALRIHANDVTLDCAGRTIMGSNAGGAVNSTNKTGITVRNCVFDSFDRAVSMLNTNHSRVMGNVFRHMVMPSGGPVAVGVYASSIPALDINLTIANNTFDNVTRAMALFSCRNCQVIQNNVTNRTVPGAFTVATIEVDTTVNFTAIGNQVEGFSISNLGTEIGINVFDDLGTVNITGNRVDTMQLAGLPSAHLRGNTINKTSSGSALTIRDSANVTSTNDTLSATGPLSFGILLWNDAALWTSNSTFTGLRVIGAGVLTTSLTGISAIQGNLSFFGTTIIGSNTYIFRFRDTMANLTFWNTNFSRGNASIVIPYFNISTNLTTRRLEIDASNFELRQAGATMSMSVNASNLTMMNRSATLYYADADCAGFGITYNETFVTGTKAIQSAIVAFPGSLACAAPGMCTAVSCAGRMLSFAAPQWSTYAVTTATGSIMGNVKNCWGSGNLSNAIVWLLNRTGGVAGTRVTDAFGNFSFANLPYSNYTLVVNYTGYTNARRNLTLQSPAEIRDINAGEICPLASDCEADCTLRGEDICDPACDGVNGCSFQFGVGGAGSCEGSRDGLRVFFNTTHDAVCCSSSTYIRKTTGIDVSVPGQNVVKMTSVVNFRDAFKYVVGAKMHVIVYEKRK